MSAATKPRQQDFSGAKSLRGVVCGGSVPALLTFLDPQPQVGDLPVRMPSPFSPIPHLLARQAAKIVAADLKSVRTISGHDFAKRGEGKMLGVLVVLDSSRRVGFLRAVSGTLGGSWLVPGFVPPLFDVADRDSFWPGGQKALANIEEELQELLEGEVVQGHRGDALRLATEHGQRREQLARKHAAARSLRAVQRTHLQATAKGERLAEGLAALAEESQRHRREGKLLRRELKVELDPWRVREAEYESKRLSLKRSRRELSNSLLEKIQDGYRFVNGNGEEASLRGVFAPDTPPGGSGDCAAPKLLGYANANRLLPIALAEFWWGASPLGGGRHTEHFYPPCKSKCSPLLPFLLKGIEHEEPPLFATEAVSSEDPPCLFEDDAIVVVDKPSGMLSVPGTHARRQDSVQSRLRTRYPHADGPLLTHRLDLDTSGLLVMAKSLEVYRHMQALFAKRHVQKRYIAWLDGCVRSNVGQISLALRVDLEDRPRQIYCPEHGKEAVTEFSVLERRSTSQGEFTKVELRPQTGRTHQLRVHASHELGLGAPIIGDRLYGKGDGRLLLHAYALRFPHPLSGEYVDFKSPLPQRVENPDLASIHLKL